MKAERTAYAPVSPRLYIARQEGAFPQLTLVRSSKSESIQKCNWRSQWFLHVQICGLTMEVRPSFYTVCCEIVQKITPMRVTGQHDTNNTTVWRLDDANWTQGLHGGPRVI